MWRALYEGPVLGVVRLPKESFSVLGAPPGNTLRPLAQPKLSYYADPFYLRVGEERWLFVEEYLYLRNRGRLCALPLDPELQPCGGPRVVMETDRHLSFPYVFAADGDIWMVPECETSGEGRPVPLPVAAGPLAALRHPA